MRTEMCSLRDRELRGKTCILTEQTLTNIFKWGWGESKWSCRAIKKEVGKFYGGGWKSNESVTEAWNETVGRIRMKTTGKTLWPWR